MHNSGTKLTRVIYKSERAYSNGTYHGGHRHHQVVPCEMRTTASSPHPHPKKQNIACVPRKLDTFRNRNINFHLHTETLRLCVNHESKCNVNEMRRTPLFQCQQAQNLRYQCNMYNLSKLAPLDRTSSSSPITNAKKMLI